MQNISIKVTVTDFYKESCETKEKEAILSGDRLSFEEIDKFISEIKKINSMLKNAAKRGLHVNLEVLNYDWSFEKGIDGFDRWFYSGIASKYEIIGYYLIPDTNYTNEKNDIFYDYTLNCFYDGKLLWERV